MKTDSLNNELRKALQLWGFKKTDGDRYEFSQTDKKMVWTGLRDYHFTPCTRTYAVTFEYWRGDVTATTRVIEDSELINLIRFQPCPWGWQELSSQVWQMRTELKNEGCKIQ